ncbi:MAG TPA: hypothetical protein DDY58_08815 [Terrisporobacter glycolicus]|uniref:Uncharacterized protein n=2 Tax=Terrisporobacter TaxID=1505652 RepID=A0AAX2ZJ71_9FIRM|nr:MULTISPECIES: hypothetical protein [Terrisporobacter]MBN9647298.1 hypothetical protein [Terrisporobacter glycolicus]UEL48530.1 hypothetical protein JW646_03495 [Terrisporobacter hibernicus]SFJ36388.1 hypothetical protein SAMN02910355_2442 [Terrisporobacter glycolicus]HBI92516.1 hypothetical protein [Terrisporobacter hibernicus]
MIKDNVLNEEVFKEIFDKFVSTSNARTNEELIVLRDYTISYILDYFNDNLTPNNAPIDFISCDEITVEVKDKTTNRIFRRNLDVSYIENSNGLKLMGENLKGEPSEIVFLSDTAINKIIDVTGQGLNKSRCHD